jgi:spermidine/putrescine transport system permease protein
MNRTLKLYTAFAYGYLYLPILILVLFSFNTQKLNLRWQGFTWHWYEVLFQDGNLLQAAQNSLLIALVATMISTVTGTLAALGLERFMPRGRVVVEALLYLSIIVPDVVLGIGLLILFAEAKVKTGLGTIILAHIVLCTPFVALTVRARLQGINQSLEEAAMDLGANPLVTFWRITLPTIAPGVISGALLALTLSLDDYVVTYFTTGPGATTLPLKIYGMVRFSITPEINALSTLWIATVFLVLLIGQWLGKKPMTKS